MDKGGTDTKAPHPRVVALLQFADICCAGVVLWGLAVSNWWLVATGVVLVILRYSISGAKYPHWRRRDDSGAGDDGGGANTDGDSDGDGGD
jgi:hypothetical protein